jgi:hypothetical protein
LFLPILGPSINKKIQNTKKIKKNISEKINISERPRNYQKLVDKDQNIQD